MIINSKCQQPNYSWLKLKNKEQFKIHHVCFGCSERPCNKETCQCDCHKKEK